jgi:hypothetical protein
LAASDAQRVAAAAAWVLTRCSIASRLSLRPVRVGNSGSVGLAGAFDQPGGEHGLGVGGERDGALFSALAVAVDVRAGAEHDIAAVEADELGDAQAGVDGDGEDGAVAPAFPAGLVGGVDERGRLVGGEVADGAFLVAFGRDREHASDRGGVLGVAQGGVFEQPADRGQAQVAAADAVVAVVLEVIQERRDERLVEIAPVERGGLFAGRVVDVDEQ